MKFLSTVTAAVCLVADQATAFVNTAPAGTSIASSHLYMSTTAEETATTIENENPRKIGLALQLDDGTRKSHSVAESTAFVSGFFKGLSTKQSYSNLMTSLYFVYEAMEDEFDKTLESTVKTMDYPELRRLKAVELDMGYFYGEGWKNNKNIQPSPATKKYVSRIRDVAKNNPKLLLAHQYSRYLGDLFGGQKMSGMATKSLNLEEGKGIAFYQFDDIETSTTTDFITAWYKKLNELDLTENEKQDIVDEANLVFALNIEIFEELEGSPFSAVLKYAWKSFKEKLGM